jgi:hypothetical protein
MMVKSSFFYVVGVLFFLLPIVVFGQRKRSESRMVRMHSKGIPADSSVRSVNFDLHYGAHQPVGLLNSRFGDFKSAGFGVFYKMQQNWLIGIDADYFFGKLVKEDSILKNLKTADGNIISSDGQFGEIKLYGRGYFVGATVGKLLPFRTHIKNTGLRILFKAGYFQHRIKILGDADLYPLSETYKRGYDRLTSGFSIGQSISYFHMSSNRLLNYTIGFEFLEGFTQGRRVINFDTGKSGLDKRIDVLVGLRASWMLPVYIRNQNSVYSF